MCTIQNLLWIWYHQRHHQVAILEEFNQLISDLQVGGQTKNGLGRKDMVKSKICNRLDYRAITFDCRRRAFDINCVASDEDEDGSLFEVSGFLIFCSEFGRISGIWVELSCHQRLGRKACKAHILLWRHREVLWPSFAFSCGVCLKMNPLPRRYKMLSCVR